LPRRETCGSTDPASDQIRNGDKPQDREGIWLILPAPLLARADEVFAESFRSAVINRREVSRRVMNDRFALSAHVRFYSDSDRIAAWWQLTQRARPADRGVIFFPVLQRA
jgi:hypothetical protein